MLLHFPVNMRRLPVFLLVVILAIAMSACHDVGDVKVLSLAFDGTKAFNSDALRRVLATRQSGWLPWSPKHYFDRKEFEADLKRIVAFYSDRGFPDARITGVDVAFNKSKDGVNIKIGVDEGTPVMVEDVRFEGFDVLPADGHAALESMPLKAGGRRDRDLVRATRDQASRLFRDRGYPQAIVDAGERPGTSATSVIVTYRAEPGPQMAFGPVKVQGLETLLEKNIVRELAFKPGELFDERKVARSQRKLTALELLDVAVVTPRFDAADGNKVPMTITVTEGKPRLLRFGLGYGTEEKARATLNWQHLNFYGGAKQATVDAKWSGIERGIELALIDPYAWRSGLSSRIAATAWRADQLTYESRTLGGSYGLSFQTDRTASYGRPPILYRGHVVYAYERIQYGIRPEFLADQSRRDERIALGLDPETGRASGGLARIEIHAERHALDNIPTPRRGTYTSARFEYASPAIGGTYRYFEFGGEGRGFLPVGPAVLATRLEASTIVSRQPELVPFSKRYFLGGSVHLRGWSRYEVSPLDAEGRPIGGRSLLDFSTELRLPVRQPSLSVVGFLDGGNVWRGGVTFMPGDLRWAAGVGLRYLTPVGAVRVDLARQLTPISNLVINGVPSRRTWRLHFNLGHTF